MAKQKAKTPEVLDLAPANPDDQLVESTGEAIRAFLGGLSTFFVRAREIEQGAALTLAEAQQLRPPTSGEEDLQVQEFARRVTRDRKEAEAHWTITATVSGFHRRLTARRAKATDPLEKASILANGIHNTYVEQERRKAAQAQEKLRLEAEAQARADREAEVAKLEADAVRREEASTELSDRETLFVEYVSVDGDGQGAARRAGFKNPLQAAARLLSNGKIQKAVQAKREAATMRQQAAARREEPLDVDVPTVQADVTTKGNRDSWSGEVLDLDALLEAFRGGKHGIPADLFMVNPAMLNQYARALERRLDLWPGVRAKKTTRIV